MYVEKSAALAAQINGFRPPEGKIAVWWLGQSGFVVKTPQYCLVTDPYLSTTLEDLTRDLGPEMRHVRMMPVPVAPEALTCVDFILCSHDHGDHYDAASVKGILKGSPNARVIVPPAAAPSLARDGIDSLCVHAVGEGDRFVQEGLEITAIRAKHNAFDYTEAFGYPYVGYIIRTAGRTIYHGGDTILFDELPGLLRAQNIDIGFMAINGYDDARIRVGFQSNCTYAETAELARAAGVRLVIPCHYDMFTANTEQVGKFVNYMNAGQDMPAYLVPVIGEPFVL